ncbi:ribbon-helix-helix protein, CopG family [Candidatus Woesearchaeota archaeon]|nr:ribbon-helix-helix protein, CopG family [Candidatus Woesearchaeota archaeon]
MKRRSYSRKQVFSEKNRPNLYDRFITIRASSEEIDLIDKIVKKKGFKNRSEFIAICIHSYFDKESASL